MRELRRLAWAAMFAALATTSALGQTTSGTTTGITTTGNTATTANTGNTGNTSGSTAAGSRGGNSQTQQAGNFQLQTFQKAPVISGVSAYTTTGTSVSAADPSNFLRTTYANPYYQGTASASTAAMPGGFGAPLYGTSTGTTGRTTQGGRGNQGGLGATGTSGSINVQDPGGVIATLPRQIAYPSQIKFQAPAIAPAQLQADLSGMISRTTIIANPAGVQVVMGEGNSVILRGTVADGDEARAVEGMIRMTPGVRQVRNELAFPKP